MREFLARALPWPQEGEQPSYVNVHYVIRLTDKTTGKPLLRPNGKQAVAVPGRACRSPEEAARTIEWANTLSTDVYVCMSSQRTAEEKLSKKNRKYYAAIRGQTNIARHKSLYIDVDVKPEDPKHGYATREEAVSEFVRIREALRLPLHSFAISSGSGGFHAHWTLVDPIDHDRWARLAGALCAAFVGQGFRGDTQCIVDGVRLLRVPGTWNHKSDPPRPVTQLGQTHGDQFIEALEGPLAPYFGMYSASVPKAVTVTRSTLGTPAAVFSSVTLPGLSDGLAAGMEILLPTIEEIANGCPFLADTLATGGASNNSNPIWLQTINISLFTQGGRATAHKLCQGHPNYSAADVDAFYDRQQGTQRARDLGWPRCQTIASYGAPQCATCPRLSLGSSPLARLQVAAPSQAHAHGAVVASNVSPGAPASALQVAPATATPLADLPSNYQYDANNLISRVETDDQGVQTLLPITTFVIEKPWLQQEPPVLNFSTHTHQGYERQIRVPYESIVDKNAFGKMIARQGMLPGRQGLQDLGDFFVAWIEKMRADSKNVVNSMPFGWSTKGGKLEGFVYAGHMWSTAVPRPSANPDPMLSNQYKPSGDIAPWLAASKLITSQQRPALDAILAASFAAPLVRFTGQTGLYLSTYSTHSGIGKTTALKVAQAVWGHPQRAVQQLDDTQNSVMKKIGDIKNLPLFWDELKTDEDTQKFMKLAFQLSSGKEKSRLAADTSYREPGTWQTLLCSTSNSSVLAHILGQTKTTAAGLYRVFEYEVPKGVTGQIEPTAAATIIGALDDNYGFAGLQYAQFLGANHTRIAKDVADLSRRLEQQYKVQADERFWLALMATLICGAHYANELGLTDINAPALGTFLVERFQSMRFQRKTTTVDIHEDLNVIGIMSRYLNEHRQGYTLVTNIMHRGAGRPVMQPAGVGALQGGIVFKGDITRMRAVRIHVGEDDHWVRLIKAPFEEWLQERGLTPPLIFKQLAEQFRVVEVRSRLGAGTLMVTASEPCLEFNYGDPVFQGMLEL